MSPKIIDRGRGPEIAGTRITVYDILDYTSIGWHHSTIAATLRLSSDQVLAAIRYIEEHKEEVMPRYQAILERAPKGSPLEVEARREQSRKRLQAELERVRKLKLQGASHDGNSRGP